VRIAVLNNLLERTKVQRDVLFGIAIMRRLPTPSPLCCGGAWRDGGPRNSKPFGSTIKVFKVTTSTSPVLTNRIRRFLAAPRVARLCTIGKDGYPHVVPIYFTRVGDDIIFGTDRDEAKVRNALRNPRVAVVIGGDPETDDAGYMIQGNLSVEHHPRTALVRRLLRRYETVEEAEKHLAEWGDSDRVLLRLRPARVIRLW